MLSETDGFHLIELLIVISIIGILSAFCVTSYNQHMVAATRLEAATMLQKLAIAIEGYHIEHDTYRGIQLAILNMPEWIAKHRYQLQIQAAGNTEYLIAAIPQGMQAEHDRACLTLTLNEKGERGITGTGQLEECW